MAYVGANTNYTVIGTDIGAGMVTKEYLIDAYPSLVDTMKTAGLWLWGRNTNGQLGTNDITHRSSPIQTVAGGANWKQVDGGFFHTAAIKTDGTLWLWGRNTQGQLGTNDLTHRSSPVQTVSGGTNWKQVSAGGYGGYTAAIKTDGTLWLWGSSSDGKLGTNDITLRSSPVQTVSGGTNWKQVSAGYEHTAAIKTDGTLWLWGRNTNGQLGDNSITHRSSPVQTISGGTNWKQVSAGGYHTTTIKTDGTLWLWGSNAYGQLGDNSITHRSSPVQTISGGSNWKQVSGGFRHTVAIKTDGTLWLWGRNNFGQLGDNTATNRSSPVQTVAGGTNWKQVSNDVVHTAAIKTDGTLWSWGFNTSGQLGINDSTNRSSPVQTISGGTNWKQVSAGGYHTACIRDDSDDPL
jgi:alpha-tubulin suppressor-like RCC1 family protein